MPETMSTEPRTPEEIREACIAASQFLHVSAANFGYASATWTDKYDNAFSAEVGRPAGRREQVFLASSRVRQTHGSILVSNYSLDITSCQLQYSHASPQNYGVAHEMAKMLHKNMDDENWHLFMNVLISGAQQRASVAQKLSTLFSRIVQ